METPQNTAERLLAAYIRTPSENSFKIVEGVMYWNVGVWPSGTLRLRIVGPDESVAPPTFGDSKFEWYIQGGSLRISATETSFRVQSLDERGTPTVAMEIGEGGDIANVWDDIGALKKALSRSTPRQ